MIPQKYFICNSFKAFHEHIKSHYAYSDSAASQQKSFQKATKCFMTTHFFLLTLFLNRATFLKYKLNVKKILLSLNIVGFGGFFCFSFYSHNQIENFSFFFYFYYFEWNKIRGKMGGFHGNFFLGLIYFIFFRFSGNRPVFNLKNF